MLDDLLGNVVFSLRLKKMSVPAIFYIAFVLGVNWNSRVGSFKKFLIFNLIVFAFVLPVKLFTMFSDIEMLTGVIFFVVFFRSLITWSFVGMGVLRHRSDERFFDYLLRDSERSSNSVPPKCLKQNRFLLLFVFVLPLEVVTGSFGPESFFVLRVISSVLIASVQLVVVSLYVFCCLHVQRSYEALLENVSRISVHTTLNGLAKIRLSQALVNERVSRVNRAFGVKIFLTVIVIQIVLLEKLDRLIFLMVNMNEFGDETKATAASIVGIIITLVFISYYSWTTGKHRKEVLKALMEINTKKLDGAAAEQISLMAEDLHTDAAVFSAAGCFDMGFQVLSGAVQVLFSFLIIIAPVAYRLRKSGQQSN